MKCLIDDCQEDAGQLWKGKSYCATHYDEVMSKDFEKEWSCWGDNMQPSHRFLYLCGRYINECKWKVINGSITGARLHDRAYNFLKDDAGFTFEITRHPGAFKDDFNPSYEVRRIVQKWKVSIKDGIAEFIEDRPWTIDDPDP